MTKLPEIPVIYSFARSGGTLANQLLGSHSQCLVLSEVNPAASYKPVADQALEWLDLVDESESHDYSKHPYAWQIAELFKRARVKGKVLIVRDWPTVNFLAGTAGSAYQPSGQLEQHFYLQHAGLQPSPVVLSRQSAAVYASIKKSFSHLGNLAVVPFADAYLSYAKAVAGYPVIHLEDLQADPEQTLGKILEYFGLDKTQIPAVIEAFPDFDRCTGNNTLFVAAESSRARAILPAANKMNLSNPTEAMHEKMAEADRLLGYD